MSYYEMMIEQLLGGGSPEYGGEQGRRTAAADSSLMEDDMLRYKMKSKRKKGKNERIPSGSFALAEYPMLQNAIDKMHMPGGSNVQGYFGYMSKEQQDEADRKNKEWAAIQQSMLNGGNFVSRMGGR